MSLTDDIREKVKRKEVSLDSIADEIIITDAKKEEYDGAISTLDKRLVIQINEVDQTLADVQTAYQDRINVGCRTDMFWSLAELQHQQMVLVLILIIICYVLNYLWLDMLLQQLLELEQLMWYIQLMEILLG